MKPSSTRLSWSVGLGLGFFGWACLAAPAEVPTACGPLAALAQETLYPSGGVLGSLRGHYDQTQETTRLAAVIRALRDLQELRGVEGLSEEMVDLLSCASTNEARRVAEDSGITPYDAVRLCMMGSEFRRQAERPQPDSQRVQRP